MPEKLAPEPPEFPPFEFEGRLAPGSSELGEALGVEADRAWLVRAAVVYPPVADAVARSCERWLREEDASRWRLALELVGALGVRSLVDCLAERLPAFAADDVAVARDALTLVVALASPGRASRRETLRWALGTPELRVLAWGALGADDPEAVLPHLGELLRQAPELAGEVGRRFALIHTPHCHDAARAVASLPEATRRAFAAELEKHLRRVFQIRRWAECRRILFGR